jgi:hypothetical protein
MADKKDHGTYEREYYSEKWDHITKQRTGDTFWRDRKSTRLMTLTIQCTERQSVVSSVKK